MDRKSLRTITSKTADLGALVQDCVCFANRAGGALWIGIEDGKDHPPSGQRVEPGLLDRIRNRVSTVAPRSQASTPIDSRR